MPLTGVFHGECAANSGAALSEETLRECCNRGYARATCALAATVEPDAVQFLIKSDQDGIIEVAWSLEQNHHPLKVGTMRVGAVMDSGDSLARQAFALAEQYRKQRGD